MKYFVTLFIIINLVTCIVYGVDKLKAVGGVRRTPEKVLLGLAFVGGSLGAWIGMQIFRHKTCHRKFQILVPLFLILHIAVILFAYFKFI